MKHTMKHTQVWGIMVCRTLKLAGSAGQFVAVSFTISIHPPYLPSHGRQPYISHTLNTIVSCWYCTLKAIQYT